MIAKQDSLSSSLDDRIWEAFFNVVPNTISDVVYRVALSIRLEDVVPIRRETVTATLSYSSTIDRVLLA